MEGQTWELPPKHVQDLEALDNEVTIQYDWWNNRSEGADVTLNLPKQKKRVFMRWPEVKSELQDKIKALQNAGEKNRNPEGMDTDEVEQGEKYGEETVNNCLGIIVANMCAKGGKLSMDTVVYKKCLTEDKWNNVEVTEFMRGSLILSVDGDEGLEEALLTDEWIDISNIIQLLRKQKELKERTIEGFEKCHARDEWENRRVLLFLAGAGQLGASAFDTMRLGGKRSREEQ